MYFHDQQDERHDQDGRGEAHHPERPDPDPGESVGHEAGRQHSEGEGHVQHQEVPGDFVPGESGHVVEPGPGPQPLYREPGSHCRDAHRGDPPEEPVAEDEPEAREGLPHRVRAPFPLGIVGGNGEEDEEGDRRGHRGEDMKDVAPARPPFECHLDGSRCGHGAEAAEPHDEAVHERPPPAREPDRDGLERGHEPTREADSDEGSPEGQQRE